MSIIRFLIASDGLLNKLLKNSLNLSKLGRIWIHPGKNRFTKSSHDWMITFQSTLNLRLFWNNWNKSLDNYRLEQVFFKEIFLLIWHSLLWILFIINVDARHFLLLSSSRVSGRLPLSYSMFFLVFSFKLNYSMFTFIPSNCMIELHTFNFSLFHA